MSLFVNFQDYDIDGTVTAHARYLVTARLRSAEVLPTRMSPRPRAAWACCRES